MKPMLSDHNSIFLKLTVHNGELEKPKAVRQLNDINIIKLINLINRIEYRLDFHSYANCHLLKHQSAFFIPLPIFLMSVAHSKQNHTGHITGSIIETLATGTHCQTMSQNLKGPLENLLWKLLHRYSF